MEEGYWNESAQEWEYGALHNGENEWCQIEAQCASDFCWSENWVWNEDDTWSYNDNSWCECYYDEDNIGATDQAASDYIEPFNAEERTEAVIDWFYYGELYYDEDLDETHIA